MRKTQTFFIPANAAVVLMVVFLLSGISKSDAQQARWLHVNPGLQISAERDLGFSPLLYSGTGGMISLGYGVERDHSTDFVDAFFSSGNLSNRWETGMQVGSGGILAFRFYHGGEDAGRGFQWGWSNNNELSVRDNESMTNFNNRFDYFTSFGPAGRYRLPFEFLGHGFLFQALAHVQLIGFKLQSSFVSQNPKGYEVQTVSGWDVYRHSVELFVPGSSWNFGLRPSLQYRLRSGNSFSINYRYDFTRLEGAHRVTKSRGKWFVGLIVAL
ncbi:MAG: hypothetical protein R6U86_05080 [Bacteroidales bacterium]